MNLMTNIPNIIAVLSVLFLEFLQIAPPERGPEDLEAPSIRVQAAESHAKVAQAVEGMERFWSAPFVLADRELREVHVWGQFTGMPAGDPVEFFVIGELSGQDYESLMLTFALPSDIHKALEFIGLEPGAPVNQHQHRFWPRGDHVSPSLRYLPPGEEKMADVPVHEWIMHGPDQPMAPSTWVFTGSTMMPAPRDPDTLVYAADVFGPNSIASSFNHNQTVFDLPKQGSKTGVYGFYNLNPDIELPDALPLLLRLQVPDEASMPVESDRRLSLHGESPAFRFDEDLATDDFDELAAFLTEQPGITWLKVDFAGDVLLRDLIRWSQKLDALEKEHDQIRVEPAPEGHLYYLAYVADPRFRDRNQRPSQPLELHIRRLPGGDVHAWLVQVEEQWGEGRRPTLVPHRHDLPTPDAWAARILEDPPLIRVLFVMADSDLRHEDLLTWTQPVLHHFPVVFVYEESKADEAADAPAEAEPAPAPAP